MKTSKIIENKTKIANELKSLGDDMILSQIKNSFNKYENEKEINKLKEDLLSIVNKLDKLK